MTHSWHIRPKVLAKEVLYRTGGLGALHRRRNRETLSVLMFHRVIDPDAPAWQGANPLFTMSTRFFEQLLRLIKRHYTPVGLETVARARRGEAVLPPRALLVTFDDGWADNVEFAAPLLRQAEVPAVFFVATGAVKSGEAFWQERLFASLMVAGEGSDQWVTLGRTPGIDETIGDTNFPRKVMRFVSCLESRGGRAGEDCAAQFSAMDDRSMPQMMTPEDITRLAEDPLFDFGTHGVSHTPFPALDDPGMELVQSWDDLSSWCAPPVKSLSFPHGRYTSEILDQTKSTGYELIFDSDKTLCGTGDGIDVPACGRFEIRPPGSDPFNSDYGRYLTDDFDAGRIAAEMFLRPIAVKRPGGSTGLR